MYAGCGCDDFAGNRTARVVVTLSSMQILNGFLLWFSAHCWGCWLGARRRKHLEPMTANPAFVSNGFLLFTLGVSTLDAALIFLLAPLSTAVALAIIAVGVTTGVLHGREEYSSS